MEHVCARYEIRHGRWVCEGGARVVLLVRTLCMEGDLKWDFPRNVSFLLFDIQSTRSSACVRVQTI